MNRLTGAYEGIIRQAPLEAACQALGLSSMSCSLELFAGQMPEHFVRSGPRGSAAADAPPLRRQRPCAPVDETRSVFVALCKRRGLQRAENELLFIFVCLVG